MAMTRKLLAVAMELPAKLLELAMGSLKYKKMSEPQPLQSSVIPQSSNLLKMMLQVTMTALLPRIT
jgi:hypothetical protein